MGSAALLVLTKSTSIVWFAFPISEIIIFALSFVFLRGIYKSQLDDGVPSASSILNVKPASGNT